VVAFNTASIPVPGLCEIDKIALNYREMVIRRANEAYLGEDEDELELTIGDMLLDYDEQFVNVIVKWADGSYSFHPHTNNTIHGVFWRIDHALAFPIQADVKIALMPDMVKEEAADCGEFFDTAPGDQTEQFMESVDFFAGVNPA
jgi:hypothetical protein